MPLDIFNAFEAALWLAMAIAVMLRYRRAAVGTRRIALGTSFVLALFAVSDLIEMRTGAWWRPTGLLILKGACVPGLIGGFSLLLKRGA